MNNLKIHAIIEEEIKQKKGNVKKEIKKCIKKRNIQNDI